MSDGSPLIVPIEVEALVVNDDVRGDGFQRWTYSYRSALDLFESAEPPPFGPVDTQFTEAGGTIVQGTTTVSEYYNGVYLKWRLPDALRHGQQDSATGTTTFPHVPNRWLVMRDGQAAWLVESDYQRTPGTAATYADTGSDFVGTAQNPMTIGLATPLSASGWTEPGTPTYLTAVAPGNLGFSAYQPACMNVFSLVDQLGAAPGGPYEYAVLGWHSDAADDPLNGADAESFTDRMNALGWQLPVGSDPAAIASSVVYYGTVGGVSDPSNVTASGAPSTSDVSVAIGSSTARALSTLVAAQASADKAQVDAELLEALVVDLVRVYDSPDGPAEVDEAAFTAGFDATTGGSSWTLVPATAPGGPAPPALTPDQVAQLATINQAQAAADAALRALQGLQSQLYAMWFKYELLGVGGGDTTLTQADLAPSLDPTDPTSLAGRTRAAKTSADDQAAAVAAMTASGQAPAGYAFKQVNGPSFYESSDPVVLLSKAGAPDIAAVTDELTCRLSTQIVTGYETAGGQTVTASSPGVSIPQPVTGTLGGIPWPATLVEALLGETYFLDTLPSGATPIGTVPVSGRGSWAQPWRPMYLMYQGNYYPIDHDTGGTDNWTFQSGSYAWNGEGAAPTANAVQLQGRILLTPQASLTVGAQLQKLLDTTPDLSTDERAALEALQAYVKSKDDWDLLSQALDGFGDQLLKRTTGAFPSPATADIQTTPSMADLIGGGAGNPPLPSDDGAFQPWRSGQFGFHGLAVVDEWGQTVFVADAGDFQNLVLHRPPEMMPAPVSVLAPAPDPLVQLSPALLQPGRLDFDMVSATDQSQVLGLDPGVDPICGWLLPNHLDQALMAFDADGFAIGELGVGIGPDGQPAVVWRPAPGTKYTTWQSIEAIPHFGPFLQVLNSGSAADLQATLAAIDETLWTTTPVGTAFDRNLATLAGRPLAMVRARLAFELAGDPLTDPSWQYTLSPVPTPAPGWSYAIELGNLEQLSDGLVGYFSETDGTLYVVAQSGATAAGYLKLIGTDGLIDLTFDGTTEAYVSMLVDPRAAVHATTDVLPVASVTLPPGLVTSALANIDLSFRAGPVLAGTETTADGTALLIPAPAGGGKWSWIDASASGAATTPIAPPGTQARLADAPPVLRSGWLDLKSAFADQSEEDPQR